MHSEIGDILCEHTGYKMRGKDRQKDLNGLIDAIEDLDNTAWRKIPEKAQAWFNDQVVRMKDDPEATIEDFPDLTEEEPEEEQSDEGEGEEAEAAPSKTERRPSNRKAPDKPGRKDDRRTAGKGGNRDTNKRAAAPSRTPAKPAGNKSAPKAATKTSAQTERAPSGRVGGVPKPEGLKYEIKKMILKKPKISAAEIMDGIKGVKPSEMTVAAIRAEFRHSLVCLMAQDWLKKKIDL